MSRRRRSASTGQQGHPAQRGSQAALARRRHQPLHHNPYDATPVSLVGLSDLQLPQRVQGSPSGRPARPFAPEARRQRQRREGDGQVVAAQAEPLDTAGSRWPATLRRRGSPRGRHRLLDDPSSRMGGSASPNLALATAGAGRCDPRLDRGGLARGHRGLRFRPYDASRDVLTHQPACGERLLGARPSFGPVLDISRMPSPVAVAGTTPMRAHASSTCGPVQPQALTRRRTRTTRSVLQLLISTKQPLAYRTAAMRARTRTPVTQRAKPREALRTCWGHEEPGARRTWVRKAIPGIMAG